jgi:hypothetical protein
VSRYGLLNERANDLYTLNGQTIVHDNRAELEWLFPKTRVVRLSDGNIGPILRLCDHPQYVAKGITFPLKREDFR